MRKTLEERLLRGLDGVPSVPKVPGHAATNGLRGKLERERPMIDSSTFVPSHPSVLLPVRNGMATPLADAIILGENRAKVDRLAERTTDDYRDAGRAFIDWFSRTFGHLPSVADLTVAAADQYLLDREALAARRGETWKPDTMAHYVRELRSAGKYVAKACGLAGNPLEAMTAKSAGRGRSQPKADRISDSKIVEIFATLDPENPYNVVTRGIIALGLEDGPRTSELASLDVEDFSFAEFRGTDLGPVIHLRHPAKGGEERTLPLGVHADRYVLQAIGHRTSGPLFPGRDGDRSTPRALRDRVSRAGKRAGTVLHPQRLRRNADTWQATYGASKAQRNLIFGWAPSAEDVESGHYNVPDLEQLLYAHQTRHSPLDRLVLRLMSRGLPPLR